ncbi:hypothetical protein BRI6_2458 [plant metagenome]|uniref:Uncharacterized protein n=1 Tax=plant metagenome TaxID=1297885 RepID=A0A484XFH9_9ZZZZ
MGSIILPIMARSTRPCPSAGACAPMSDGGLPANSPSPSGRRAPGQTGPARVTDLYAGSPSLA